MCPVCPGFARSSLDKGESGSVAGFLLYMLQNMNKQFLAFMKIRGIRQGELKLQKWSINNIFIVDIQVFYRKRDPWKGEYAGSWNENHHLCLQTIFHTCEVQGTAPGTGRCLGNNGIFAE